jgi:hypothetical protein
MTDAQAILDEAKQRSHFYSQLRAKSAAKRRKCTPKHGTNSKYVNNIDGRSSEKDVPPPPTHRFVHHFFA